MFSFQGSFAQLRIVLVWVALLSGFPTIAFGQDSIACTNFNDAAVSSAIIGWVGIEKGKPFIAERVVNSWDQSFHEHDLVARDKTGRIYIEQHNLPWQFYSSSSHHDANTIWALGTARILDRFGGKSIDIVPGSRTADIKQLCPEAPSFQQSYHPYSYTLTLLFISKTAASILVEDLGNKRLEEFQAHGIRITWLGTDQEGDWSGRPIRSTETWRSDELGATLLMISTGFRERVSSRSALVNIRAVEPEASLFEVPPGYKINQSSKEASVSNVSSRANNKP
jgi:hypothetical protein